MPAELAPHQQLARLIAGYGLSQAIHVAARLGLADHVQAGPRSTDELARETGTHPRALYRLLRTLAGFGIFALDAQDRFGPTPLSDCLRQGVPGSQRAMALMVGEGFYQAYGELLHCVRTGGTGFEKVYGAPIFDYLAQHPELAKLFDETMVSVHGRESAAMADAYDFGAFRTLADIGGGNGSTLATLLGRFPKLRGLLFDLPNVAERARASLTAAGLGDRCQVAGGSFFDAVPAGADAYLLRHIIHDWDDGRCVQILQNVRRVLPDGGKLFVVETIVPPGNEPSPVKMLDLAMLVLPGGEERTRAEYEQLYHAAGFRLTRVVPTAAEVSIIEGEPATSVAG